MVEAPRTLRERRVAHLETTKGTAFAVPFSMIDSSLEQEAECKLHHARIRQFGI